VVRAQVDRRLLHNDFKLFEALAQAASVLCCYTVQIPQRGGRKAREAKLLLRSATMELLAPVGRSAVQGSLRVNVVLAEELDVPTQSGPLHWVLLTTEAVSSAEEARQVSTITSCAGALRTITRRGRVVSVWNGNVFKRWQIWNGCW
jgi:hypothetical protein